jgi:hypothetical protein
MSDFTKRWGLGIATVSLLLTMCGIGFKSVWHLADMASEMRYIRSKVDTFEKVAERVGKLESRVDVIESHSTRDRKRDVMMAPNVW